MWTSCFIVSVLVASVLSQVNNEMDNSLQGNVSLTSDLLDFFSIRRTYALWPQIQQEEVIKSDNCSQDFQEFFRGLEGPPKIWALKST